MGLGFSVMGVAAVAGSLFAPLFVRRFPIGRAVVAWHFLESIGVAIAALGGHWMIALAGFGLQSLAGTVSNISTFTIRQKAIPNALMGRVNAAFRMVLTLSFPLSALLLGAVTERAGARASFAISAAIEALSTALLLISPVGRYELPEGLERAV